ncbi:hypothetical protein IV203_011699 [Nitzschia inconspicua]|uniref:t-SNARE coiled-coil homology domain-containing protein n=1 Tax=Nitzschia inconspicua TaxID=303405 RepID=A0A9K3KT81_9STRA|nr:hypothetical protein IV203_011699 [Nitzschia inconspicua]
MNAISHSNNRSIHEGSCSGHAVSRSNELLSCAKTSWKISQQAQSSSDINSPTVAPSPPNFRLASPSDSPPPNLILLEDGLTLLRSMQYGLKQLQLLVRRRGHTNDPTQEIATLTKQLEQDTQELTEFCTSLLQKRRRSPQERKHWEYVVQWFQQVAARYSEQLQECLKLRGEILTEQAQQRRKLTAANGKSHNANRKPPSHLRGTAAATPLFDSPLFHDPSPPKKATTTSRGSQYNGNGGGLVAAAAAPPAYTNGHNAGGVKPTPNGYGGGVTTPTATGYNGTTGYGYNGSQNNYYYNNNINTAPTSNVAMGVRQRRGGSTNMSNMNSTVPFQEQEEEEQKVHSQIQIRQNKRETQKRLNEARQAETMLGELGQMFGKMTTLISQQGETLEKIEDDVECALVDVTAGQEELTKLYGIKKGNRPLIIKTFAILNFLIIFMRAYYKK